MDNKEYYCPQCRKYYTAIEVFTKCPHEQVQRIKAEPDPRTPRLRMCMQQVKR